MTIRNLKLSDLIEVEKIHSKESQFPMPNVNSGTYPVQKVIIKDDKIVGSAFAQITSEISLSLSSELSNLEKAKIIKDLFHEFLKSLKFMGIEDTHVFVVPEDDLHYIEFLKNNFNFVEAKGKALYLRP